MITRDIIAKGFENNLISIENEFAGCIGICCRIGENAFYFLGNEDENIYLDEYWKSYTLEMTIDMIFAVLESKEAASANGIYADELEYYDSILNETKIMKKVKVEIFADVEEDNIDKIKKMSHHAEGITAEYPELENISVRVVFDQLENLVGRRYANLELLKNDIEVLTGKRVNAILESESERFEDTDYMIDYEFEEFDIHTLWYLKDNAGNYYITEV